MAATTIDSGESLDGQILACTVDLNAFLPKLAARYSPVAVVGALASHVGGGLKVFMETGVCTPEQARSVLQRLERQAFDTTYPYTQ